MVALIPMSHDINSRLLMRKSHVLILQFTRARVVNTWLLFYARYRAPRKAHANNDKLKSARNEHKNQSFYAYENVMRL